MEGERRKGMRGPLLGRVCWEGIRQNELGIAMSSIVRSAACAIDCNMNVEQASVPSSSSLEDIR